MEHSGWSQIVTHNSSPEKDREAQCNEQQLLQSFNQLVSEAAAAVGREGKIVPLLPSSNDLNNILSNILFCLRLSLTYVPISF